jgi:hypothetical protein
MNLRASSQYRIAIALASLLVAQAAVAGSATWKGTPVSNNWNDQAN